ncbi:hypothetical protein F3J34_24660 [Klebsiella sp. Ap-873]|nr:hypothetical protein [Klebsiella sp. Ap-873]
MKFRIRSHYLEMDEADALMFVGHPIFIGSNGYARVSGHQFPGERYVHRHIMGAGPDDVVDHIDGNKLNCTRGNMRLCTQSDNTKNVRLRKNNSSGVPGVYWSATRHQWVAQIAQNGKTIYLGRFNEKADAVAARRVAEEKYYGEFAASKGVLREKA